MRQLPLLTFYIGLALVPFDNLKFAPSEGWASISPYIFLLSALLFFASRPSVAIKILKRTSRANIFLLTALIVSSACSYLVLSASTSLIALNGVKLILGFSFFVSLTYVLSISNLGEKQAKIASRIITILATGYAISVLFGVMQFLAIQGLAPAIPFDLVFSRHYPNKVQFSFTEPSFASLHVFGIIVPSLMIFGHTRSRARNILIASGLAILLISITSGSSLRAAIDTILFGGGLLLLLPFKRKLKIVTVLAIALTPLILFPPKLILDRVNRISQSNQEGDPSTIIRRFRAESAIFGMVDNPYSALFGYGFGNSGSAMNAGFNAAYEKISGHYTEIEELGITPDGLTYSLHIKLLSEHGVLGYILIMLAAFDRRRKVLFLAICIIYLQFDSYAFYAIWIYIAARLFNAALDPKFRPKSPFQNSAPPTYAFNPKISSPSVKNY